MAAMGAFETLERRACWSGIRHERSSIWTARFDP
jgi:hypothetical protein